MVWNRWLQNKFGIFLNGSSLAIRPPAGPELEEGEMRSRMFLCFGFLILAWLLFFSCEPILTPWPIAFVSVLAPKPSSSFLQVLGARFSLSPKPRHNILVSNAQKIWQKYCIEFVPTGYFSICTFFCNRWVRRGGERGFPARYNFEMKNFGKVTVFFLFGKNVTPITSITSKCGCEKLVDIWQCGQKMGFLVWFRTVLSFLRVESCSGSKQHFDFQLCFSHFVSTLGK